MARQLRRAAKLVPGASLRGLVFDACFDNRVPNTFGVLQHFGMPNRNRVNISESIHLNIVGLATALQIDASEVLSRRYPPHGRGHRTFYGVHIMKSRIEAGVRRFSPAAIAKGILHHPATHELRDLPFSTVGWDILQDKCFCTDEGIRQGWITVNGSSRCQSCGASLGKLKTILVPDELRGSLRLISRLIDPDPAEQEMALRALPAAIRGASRTLLYDLIMNMTRASLPSHSDTEFADYFSIAMERTKALSRACDGVLQWPSGLGQITRSRDCPEYLWNWVVQNYAMLDACSHNKTISKAFTAGAVAAPVQAAQLTYTPCGTAGKVKTHHIGAMAAARLGGIDEWALKKAWDEGRFTQHFWVWGANRVRAFDPAEVIALAPRLRVLGARAFVASYLGMPVYGVEQLLAQGILQPCAPGGSLKQVAAHLNAAAALMDKMQLIESQTKHPVRFADAIRHVSGRAKPWGPAFAAMLDGSVPFTIERQATNKPLIKRLIVSADSVGVIANLTEPSSAVELIERAERWSQADALECLNANTKGPTGPVDGVSSTGIRRKFYPVQDVLERAAKGVTTSDLARRAGRSVIITARRLEAEAVPQIAPGLWDRTDGERVALGFLRGVMN